MGRNKSVLAWLALATAAAGFAAETWRAPRTIDGQPDLQGIWDTASITPLERPEELGNKAFYTRAEADALEKRLHPKLNRDRRDGPKELDMSRGYNESWFDRGAHLGSNLRTSRVIDPPNGQIPPFTAAAQKKFDEFHMWLDEHPADSAQDRGLYDRCILSSQSGPPMIPGNYNNLYQIIQTKDFVTILSEMGHQARVIPLGPQVTIHGPAQWMGNSQTHWEGETLVIETANIRFNQQSHFGNQYEGMSDENLRITERLTRISPSTIRYRATVTDPTVYSKPWTIELPMEKSKGPIYEYACHEGNYGIAGILSGERAKENRAH